MEPLLQKIWRFDEKGDDSGRAGTETWQSEASRWQISLRFHHRGLRDDLETVFESDADYTAATAHY